MVYLTRVSPHFNIRVGRSFIFQRIDPYWQLLIHSECCIPIKLQPILYSIYRYMVYFMAGMFSNRHSVSIPTVSAVYVIHVKHVAVFVLEHTSVHPQHHADCIRCGCWFGRWQGTLINRYQWFLLGNRLPALNFNSSTPRQRHSMWSLFYGHVLYLSCHSICIV